jgi:hypothetical protein
MSNLLDIDKICALISELCENDGSTYSLEVTNNEYGEILFIEFGSIDGLANFINTEGISVTFEILHAENFDIPVKNLKEVETIISLIENQKWEEIETIVSLKKNS